MKNKLIYIYIFFLIVMYVLRCITPYLFNYLSGITIFLPLIILPIIISWIYRDIIVESNFGINYLKFIMLSIAGIATALIINYFQSYCIVKWKYPGIRYEMNQAILIDLSFLIDKLILMAIMYLILFIIIKKWK